MRKKRVLVLLTGSGKTAWFEKIREGVIPETVLHALAAIDVAGVSLDYIDTVPPTLRRLLALLSCDVLISSDVSLISFLAALFSRLTFGAVGPKWILVTVNTSSVLRRLKQGSFRLHMMRVVLRTCTRIVCLARFQMRDLEAIGVRTASLTFIPYGIDAAFYEGYDSKMSEDEYVISVGHDLARNYTLLLSAAFLVPHPILIITSPRNIPPDSVVPPNVTIRYDIPITELRSLYAQARLAVVLTKGLESTEGSDCSGQTVVLEALATRTPVLISPRPWVDDYLAEGEEYLTLDPADPTVIARQVNALWEDKEVRVRLAEAGKKRFEQGYTTRIFANRLMELIQDVSR